MRKQTFSKTRKSYLLKISINIFLLISIKIWDQKKLLTFLHEITASKRTYGATHLFNAKQSEILELTGNSTNYKT